MVDDYSLSSITGIYDKYSGKTVEVKEEGEFSNGSLDFDGYLKLLVAQMSNQDFNNPMSDSDLLNQMAQYSMMEGIKNMTQQSGISYAASLVGKVVTVSEDGKLYHTGTVSAVTIDKGKPSVVVDGQTFGSSMITDVVTDEAYAELKNFLGKTVKLKGAGEDAKTGVVEGIVFKNGQGYVSVGGEPYAIWMLEIVETDESEKTEGTDNKDEVGEAGDKTENGDENTDENTGETVTESGTVNENAAAYSMRSQTLADIFMEELDRADKANSVSGVSAASELPQESLAELEELVKTAYVQVPEISAAFYAEDNEISMSSYTNSSATFGDNIEELKSISMDEYNKSTGVTDNSGFNDNSSVLSGDSSWMGTTATQAGWTYSDFNSANTSKWGSKVKGVTTEKGMSTSKCTPHRISVEKYPKEAAIADSYGTRMYDIRFINNREVTSRIKTSPVIGRLSNGMGVTEIGFSGTGQLGEVVTFENGQQRVEILLQSGGSSWIYTSGRYTIDQICASDMTSGTFTNLSPAEVAIRHYSRVDRVGSTM